MDVLDDKNNLSDEQLVVLSLENHLAFSVLVDRYRDKLLNFIRKMSNLAVEDAQDVLQDVFLKVYLNLNSFDDDLKFSSWIYSITRNQIISNYRKIKVRPEGNSIKIDETLIERLVSDFNIEKELDLKILNQQIFSVLNELKSKWKEVLVLKFFEEKDYEEISDIIKKPSGTVASMLNKAKKEFKEKYQEMYN
ncbi:MAG: sigma-70 family RNA polymerase sigma factor [Patescibacteria group bacterium]|nr:sigma-70 family RNA polymerase sigma factor [Patescibacteria group bacterium]